jgi:hypothetical protein
MKDKIPPRGNPPIDVLLARRPHQPRDPVTGEPLEYEPVNPRPVRFDSGYVDWSILDDDDRYSE